MRFEIITAVCIQIMIIYVTAFSKVDVYNFQGRRVKMEGAVSSITPVS
jgi:hypothetical protein